MNNPNNSKKLRAVLIAALLGALLFGGLSLAAVTGASHDEGGYVIGIPLGIIIEGTRFGKWLLHQPSDLLVNFAVIIVNGLLGAFLFIVPVAFWQFVVKSHSKNQTAGI
jgi:hypothetical protein